MIARCWQWTGVVAALLVAFPVAALERWRVQGSNEARFEYYERDGNPLGSIYRDTGGQAWNSLYLFFDGDDGPYDQWRGGASLLLNGSDYRARDDGVVPERLHLQRENGEGAIPYRLDIGDFFAFTSYRSLQRSLKGLQWEGQSRGSSLQVFAGLNQSEWRRIDEDRDLFAGGSWLFGVGNGGAALNLVYNDRESNPAIARVGGQQWLASIAAEQSFERIAMQVEGEFAWIDTDSDSTALASDSDIGMFLQLASATYSRIWYRLRFERYGENYRPNGAIITPDRRSYEAHLGRRFGKFELRLRAQQFRDGLESGNPLDTDIFGTDVSTTFGNQTFARMDLYQQRRTDRSGAIDQRSNVANLDLSHSWSPRWRTRLGVFAVDASDDNLRATDLLEARAGIDLISEVAGVLQWVVSPGVTWRRLDGGLADGEAIGPSLGINLRSRRQQLNLYAGQLRQMRDGVPMSDVDTLNTAADYRVRLGNHSLGLQYDSQYRESEALSSTTDHRLSLFWQWDFSVRSQSPARDRARPSSRDSAEPDLSSFFPGLSIDTARQQLLAAKAQTPTQVGQHLVYGHALLPEIAQRQRLVLQHQHGRVQRAGLLIEFDDRGRPDSLAQEFERVRENLIRRYGTPQRLQERGSFSADLSGDLAAGRFQRSMEWDVDQGVLRFGIPYLLGERLRMELQFASQPGNLQDRHWGMIAVR